MYSKVTSGTALGIEGKIISVEVDISAGLPGISMVGNLAPSVREAGDRVRTALKNINVCLPPRKVTVNLSPGDLRKTGTGFDLPIAAAILLSLSDKSRDSELDSFLQSSLILGELALDGSVLPISGVLPTIDHAHKMGIDRFIIPYGNLREASFIKDINIHPIKHLSQLYSMLEDGVIPDCERYDDSETDHEISGSYDLADVKGQETMKRGVIIAVAGFHNILLTGAAGSGKSMISKCIPGIMPEPTYEEMLELTKIYSISGKLLNDDGFIKSRPFRSPHSSVTDIAMLGGGMNVMPGEVSLATSGVLFLDEFPEFRRNVIDALRQPMEDKVINVSRLKASYTYPANFMLVAARNNCPCGFYPDRKRCRCTDTERINYGNKISYPIMDRIDIRLDVRQVSYLDLKDDDTGMSSAEARDIVKRAREIQADRYRNETFNYNSEIPQNRIDDYIRLDARGEEHLRKAFEDSIISARGYTRILKLARTIGDINGHSDVTSDDIEEALFFRNEIGGDAI